MQRFRRPVGPDYARLGQRYTATLNDCRRRGPTAWSYASVGGSITHMIIVSAKASRRQTVPAARTGDFEPRFNPRLNLSGGCSTAHYRDYRTVYWQTYLQHARMELTTRERSEVTRLLR